MTTFDPKLQRKKGGTLTQPGMLRLMRCMERHRPEFSTFERADLKF